MNSRILLWLAVIVIPAFWLGEAGGGIGNLGYAILAGLLLSITAASHGSLRHRVLFGFGVLWLWLTFFMAGRHVATRTFNSCVAEAETVRLMLLAYREQHGAFPVDIGKLQGVLPCERLFWPSLLHYQRTDTGYQLYFGDALVQYMASESQPFEARK